MDTPGREFFLRTVAKCLPYSGFLIAGVFSQYKVA